MNKNSNWGFATTQADSVLAKMEGKRTTRFIFLGEILGLIATILLTFYFYTSQNQTLDLKSGFDLNTINPIPCAGVILLFLSFFCIAKSMHLRALIKMNNTFIVLAVIFLPFFQICNLLFSNLINFISLDMTKLAAGICYLILALAFYNVCVKAGELLSRPIFTFAGVAGILLSIDYGFFDNFVNKTLKFNNAFELIFLALLFISFITINPRIYERK